MFVSAQWQRLWQARWEMHRTFARSDDLGTEDFLDGRDDGSDQDGTDRRRRRRRGGGGGTNDGGSIDGGGGAGGGRRGSNPPRKGPSNNNNAFDLGDLANEMRSSIMLRLNDFLKGERGGNNHVGRGVGGGVGVGLNRAFMRPIMLRPL